MGIDPISSRSKTVALLCLPTEYFQMLASHLTYDPFRKLIELHGRC
jgi:hypothetical protein